VFSTFIVRCTGNTSAIFFNITSCWIGRLYLDMTSTVTKNKPIYNLYCSYFLRQRMYTKITFEKIIVRNSSLPIIKIRCLRCTGNTSAIFFNITSCWIGRLYLDMTSTVTKNKPLYNKYSTLVSFELFAWWFFFSLRYYIYWKIIIDSLN
jgi:hypothetical protein